MVLKAQGTAATILGTVTDASGAAIADAAISVKNVGTGITQSTTSDAQGRYRAADLPVGDFEVTAAKTGFSTVHSGITLTVGAQTVVDFSLAVGQQQQTITVEGEVSQVETSSAAVENLVESTQMRELPLNGRNFSQLLTLAPGVVPNAPSGGLFGNTVGYAIAGGRPEGQAFLLDNSDIQDWWNHGSGSGALGTSLGVDGIGEFQILTNTYTAQFGGNGSVINAVSKAGTNSVHGSAYEFLRNSDLDARNFFDHRIGPPPFRRNQFGGTVGGPIKKDKAFFFVNYEGLRSSLGQTLIAFVPDENARNGYLPCSVAKNVTCNTATNLAYVGISPAAAPTIALFPMASVATSNGVAQVPQVANQVASENYLLARLDYNFSEKDSLFGRYVLDRANQTSPFPSTNTIPNWTSPQITLRLSRKDTSFRLL